MFCNHCGSQLAETAQFCGGCGRPVNSRAQPVAPAQPAAPPVRASRCSWCGAGVDASQSSCPQCGATLNVAQMVTQSGWLQLPGRKDMAKLQVGNSSCQIEGSYVPVADFNLAAGDSIYFTHHVLLWKDPQTEVTTTSLRGGWKRLFAGLPLIMMQAQGPGHIAFSRDAPGEMVALPIHPGHTIDVREHLFLTATSSVTYDWFQTGVWFTTSSGNDTETHYPIGMFMDRFTAPQSPGLLLLHASGNVFVRELAANQTILIKPTALIFKDPRVTMHLHFEQPRFGYTGWRSWGNRYVWLRLTGPGRVAAQSVFERIEGESRSLNKFSYATQTQW
jgi:uncharacterized protein (AIM24 family)